MKNSDTDGSRVPSPASSVENDPASAAADGRQRDAATSDQLGRNLPTGEHGFGQQLRDPSNSTKLFIPCGSTPRSSIGLSTSTEHLGGESQLLELAIRMNDVVKVKQLLTIHRDKFQINAKPPEKTFQFSSHCHDNSSNAQQSNTQTDRYDQYDSSSQSGLSSDEQAVIPFKNALHTAIDYGSVDVVRALLENGIDPNAGGHVWPALDDRRNSSSTSASVLTGGQRDVTPDGTCAADVEAAADEYSVASSTSSVIAVAGHGKNRSVLWRQRSLSLDNGKPPRRGRALLQRLRSGCSKLVRSAPAEIHDGGHQPETKKTASAPVNIMNELRRSSDVVRAILWNLSFRDGGAYGSGASNDSDPGGSGDELDVDALFDRHEQRRYADYEQEIGGLPPVLDSLSSLYSFQSLSSGGSLSAGPAPCDASDHPAAASVRPQPSPSPPPPPPQEPSSSVHQPTVGFATGDSDDASTDQLFVPKLMFKSSLSLDRINEMADVYNKRYLTTLPPIFLAVVRQNPTMIFLLLKFGASPNIQDKYGNTPLHLSIVQPDISWNCVLDLLEFGAKICIKNSLDICPSDIVDSLLRIQVHMINDCWKILSGSTAIIKGKPLDISTLSLKLIRKFKFTQTDMTGEHHGNNVEDLFGSVWSLKSKISNKSRETDEGRAHTSTQCNKTKIDKKPGVNDYGIKHKNLKALKLYNIERKFQVICRLSGNVECLGLILNGLNNYIVNILKYLETNYDLSLRHICTLLKTILNVAVMEFGEQGKKEELSVVLCSVMKVCLNALKGIHHVQFTAMAMINRVIDISVQYNVSFTKAVESDYLHHPQYVAEMNKYHCGSSRSNKDESCSSDEKTKLVGPNKKLTTMWRYLIGDQAFSAKSGNSKTSKNAAESVIGILSDTNVLSIINVLHNSLTLYKRVIGSRRLCPPSHRSSQCSYHCLQILSARTLLFMSLNEEVKSELIKEPQLKILAASLESTNDPQLLVLVLQIVASIALNPKHHRELIDRDIPNVLNQLLLPSDEWYYTNHSDKYGRYVKHHAARVLIYLGFSYRINISIFDMFQDGQPNPTISKTHEDNYISVTSIPPCYVLSSDQSKLLGVSIETAIINVLKEIEQSLNQNTTPSETFTLHWALNGKSYSLLEHNVLEKVAERKYPTDVHSSLFVQMFVACVACAIDPVLLVRLLAHRLVTTPLYPRNSSSITSMSGQDQFPPRTCRSRASSTDTNASIRRKRFNLSLDTTKCYVYDTADGISAKGKTKSSSTHSRRRRSSSSSTGGFGIEPALHATFNAFTNMIKHETFKDCPMSPDRETDEYRNSSVSLSSTKALPGGINFQFPPRSRPSLRSSNLRGHTNERSKSQANITKARADSYQQTPEQEILAFQKQLQNLPDLDSPNHALARRFPLDSGFTTAGGEFTLITRPRSRSMPRVAYESSRYLTLPDSFPFIGRLPRGRSAGTLGFQTEYHGPCGPMVISNQASSVYNSYPANSNESAGNVASVAGGVAGGGSCALSSGGSGNTYNSRRSSYSPSDRSRGRDSIACTHGGEMPVSVTPWHRSILILFETWLRTSKTELNEQHSLCVEMREFMRIVNHIGGEYSQWYTEMVTEFKELSIDTEYKDRDATVDTNKEYSKLQSAVIEGSLHCSSDEAIGLAGLQFRIERVAEQYAGTPDSLTSPDSLLDGGGPCSTLQPISEDKEHHLQLEVPAVSSPPLGPDHHHHHHHHRYHVASQAVASPTVTDEASTTRNASGQLLWSCYTCRGFGRRGRTVPERDPFGVVHRVHMYVPPDYREPKIAAKLIKELKKIVAHTLMNESELHLKRIYIDRCKRLPAFGCNLYLVKEVQRGRTKKKAARVLGLSLDKIILLDSKTKLLSKYQNTHDLLQWQTEFRRNRNKVSLEFRNSKWTLASPTERTLRDIGFVLLKILQEIDNNFLELHSVIAPVQPNKSPEIREITLDDTFAPELDSLRRILHFPEEVALLITDKENDLFYDIPPLDFLRQVTLDQDGANACNTSVKKLIDRFNAVSSWITHLIITRPTHEDRKAILSCLLRVAKECWNIGNFNGTMEIIAGLKSEKIKPFMQTVLEKEKVPLFHYLTDAMMSTSQYESTVRKALAIPDCPVVPFFGSFMREIRKIMKETPSTIVLSDQDAKVLSESFAEHEYLDGYTTMFGLDGIINMEKIYKVQTVLEELSNFHRHYFERKSYETKLNLLQEGESLGDCDNQADHDYVPVQPLAYDHGVSLIPLSISPSSNDFTIGHHELQIMHHGSTVVHWDAVAGGSRSARIFLRLERNCSTLTWRKTSWSALKRSSSGTPDYSLKSDPEDCIPNSLLNRPSVNCTSVVGLQEGYLDLSTVRDIFLGGATGRDRMRADCVTILRKYNLHDYSISDCCLGLVFGNSTSDNRILYILAPPKVLSVWHKGLKKVIKKLQEVIKTVDKRTIWLKNNYVQQYLISDGRGPKTADAIRLFGGRDWSITSNVTNNPSPEISIAKRAASMRFRKKKSVVNEGFLKPYDVNELFNKSRMDLTSSGGNSPSTSYSHLEDDKKRESIEKNIATESFVAMDKIQRKLKEPNLSDVNNMPITPNNSQLDFDDFSSLFDSFNLRMRKDLRDIFDQIRAINFTNVPSRTLDDVSAQNNNTNMFVPRATSEQTQFVNSINKNGGPNYLQLINASVQKKRIFDAIAASSIISNGTGVETSKSAATWSINDFINFLATKQSKSCTEEEARAIIKTYEPDPEISARDCISFEGFAKYMMNKENSVYNEADSVIEESDMYYPLSCYYIASSHNTYLTGHQLKGESSIDLYSQILLSGCRCVELDCWDGDDGNPLIYHGHTFTSKIPFLGAVDVINRYAFVASPYPVILSIENHCSLVQQARMAEIFETVFGEKLVTDFMFESDYEPHLPSPSQLKYKILIKNKKLAPLESDGSRSRNNNSIVKSSQAVSHHSNIGPHRSSSTSAGTTINDDIITVVEEDDDEDNDEDDEEDDDEDEIEYKKIRIDKIGRIRNRFGSKSNEKFTEDETQVQKNKKHNSQIAKELSDIVIYIQAIKFSGLNTISPSNSVRNKLRRGGGGGDGSAGDADGGTLASTSSAGVSSTDAHHYGRGGGGGGPPAVNAHHPCYKCSSLTEYYGKKLTKKRPMELMAHSETQLVRVYPASMRIDSSNFNPLNFWSYGIQMAALNYQSDDATATHVNAAMFGQNGRCGYVLKPRLMFDPAHPMYRRFNPADKELLDGLKPTRFCVNLVSGQYMSPAGGPRANVYVEIEIIGIPPDSVKKKSKTIYYNSMNPVCNETFTFRVLFDELAFVRFLVVDANTSHPLAQRVVPLRSVRHGYRHVDMRTMQNQPLPLTALFVYTRCMEDGPVDDALQPSARGFGVPSSPSSHDGAVPLPKRKTFHVMVYGIFSESSYCMFNVTQDSTAADVIRMALEKRDESGDDMKTYVLLEEVGLTWETATTAGPAAVGAADQAAKDSKVVAEVRPVTVGGQNDLRARSKRNKDAHRRIGWKNGDAPMFQRVLAYDEKPLEAQARWQGDGYFVLKKIGDDPSSRAWIISLQARNGKNGQSETSWDEIPTFLVCIYNVSAERPYVILKVPTGSTAQDILALVLVKARRMENPILFILVEELEWGKSDIRYRVLDDDEVVHKTQGRWSRVGRFVLEERNGRRDRMADGQPGLLGKTSWAIRVLSRSVRLQRGMAAMGRGWKNCGLPTLPGHCLSHPENCRETVIREAALAHRKMLVDRERVLRENLEKGGSGDGGGGLERGCDDEGSGGDDAEESTSTGLFKTPGHLFCSLWRS